MLKCAGRFLYRVKSSYNKTYQSPSYLVRLLLKRGLAIRDIPKAERYLSTISYYRLSAYMHPLLTSPKSAHKFKQGSNFEQVMVMYRFDKKLRLLLFNEIEKIEIALRTVILHECTLLFNDPFWITNSSNYSNESKYKNTIARIDREIEASHEEFIIHFKDTYTDKYPPAWMLSEILPLGVLTNIFANLRNPQARKRVALRFGLQPPVFNSWVTIITLTRNSCCHHARVWNKQNSIMPSLPKRIFQPWITLPTNPLRIYFDICIIKYFVDIISPNNDMLDKLNNLLADFPTIDTAVMGFPTGWQTEPLWQRR